jgi:hypothetical protein
MEWTELWLQNYKGLGDTAELENKLKTLGYGARQNISYLPWAIVDRIFKLQGGTTELIKFDDGITSVEVDRVKVRDEYDEGEIIPKFVTSFFINIKATWKGQTHIERYPIQDSNGRPLSIWTQNDLNKSYQRGKVKAIAIVSGIGYKLFEDGDLQFEEEPKGNETKVETKAKVEEPKTKKKVAEEPKVVVEEPKVVVEEPKVVVEEPKQVDTTIPTDKFVLEQKIKSAFLESDKKAGEIKKFLTERNVKKISELSIEDISLLYINVV